MSNDKTYQGWTNPQTWCVALTLDNTKTLQDKALSLCHDLDALKKFCYEQRGVIFSMAYWAWPEAYDQDKINWNELQDHFKNK